MARKKTIKANYQEAPESSMCDASILNDHISVNYKISLKCKNEKQKEFIRNIKDQEKQICFGVGSAGTGKTWLSLAASLQLLKSEDNPYKAIVIFVPCLESVTVLKMGYLKGDLDDKTKCYKQNAFNSLIRILEESGNANAKEIVSAMVAKNMIQFEFINFVKGKTFSNCICVLEEAEDYSKEDILLLLTRKGGPTCKMLISGDDKQSSRTDLKNKKQITGLRYASNVLEGMKEVSVTEFSPDDIVRDPLLTEIIKRFEENR